VGVWGLNFYPEEIDQGKLVRRVEEAVGDVGGEEDGVSGAFHPRVRVSRRLPVSLLFFPLLENPYVESSNKGKNMASKSILTYFIPNIARIDLNWTWFSV